MNQFYRVLRVFHRLIIFFLPRSLIQTIHEQFLSDKGVYYSQEGEDIILERYFKGKEKGFFVDVGAHHPTRFSNTYKLYLKGWNGINIDATPGSMIAFKKWRPRDTNIEVGVSDVENTITYYQFDEPALNTFSKERVDFVLANSTHKVVATKQQQTKRLETILRESLSPSQAIDLLTIDVEGLDLNILKSNDWEKHRPQFVLVEDLYKSLDEINQSECYQFLKSKKYNLVAKTFNTLLYSDSTKA